MQELIGLIMLELASEGITNFDDSQCAISQFITWLRSGHQGHPHKVLQKDLESVLGNDNVPIQYEHAKPLMWQQILFGTLPMFSELSARLSQQDKLQFKQHITFQPCQWRLLMLAELRHCFGLAFWKFVSMTVTQELQNQIRHQGMFRR